MLDDRKLTFEQAMEELEDIVSKLEEGDVPLEEAITYYKRGVELSKLCSDKLKNVENQLTQVLTEDGQAVAFIVNEEE
ncbi:exodeoxyribonuclease VII small subunit [Bacillus massilinigeriensis]|uniref:exodeoxyribonuclease VII small subunit n=1 Tax=Bacillus mediterraneensis TaxID=1805474 RepID=UPI0008F95DDF|nr:exodeoxyribonuclease VII small subunit [Bacillus mediterraneensis]